MKIEGMELTQLADTVSIVLKCEDVDQASRLYEWLEKNLQMHRVVRLKPRGPRGAPPSVETLQ